MKAVILAAGEGVRLLPLTENRSKHMIPIGGKPIMEYVVNCVRDNGIDNLLIVVGYKKEAIIQYFGDGKRFGVKIDYAFQGGVLGTADAVGLAEQNVGDEEFLVVYGDLFINPRAINAVLKAHKEEKWEITMAVVPVKSPEFYGVALLEGNKVVEIIEKPKPGEAPGNLANAGIYVFNRKIFDAIKKTQKSLRGELEITDSLRVAIKEGVKVGAVKLNLNEWVDIGRPWDLLEANERALREMKVEAKGEIEDGAKLVGPVTVLERARIRSGAYIEGPTLIGEGSEIGPNCYIRPYTSIGRSVKIGNACEIKNSIVMDGTRIAHLSYVGDSVIGEKCNFGAGTIVANLRLDDKTVKMNVAHERVDSGRRKLGIVTGDYVKTALNVSFMPGVKIGSKTWIGPNVVVHHDLPSGVFVFERREFEQKPNIK